MRLAIVIGSNANADKADAIAIGYKHSLKKTVWLWEIMPRPAGALLP